MSLILADARRVPLVDGCVQCCVSSPPYWGLRDYGTARWEGGDQACDHRPVTVRRGRNEDRPMLAGAPATNAGQVKFWAARQSCDVCGAVKVDQQIGVEATPDAFVDGLVEVFRDVRRVLTDDGVLWLNLGDSYANDGKWGGSSGGKHVAALHGDSGVGRGRRDTGLKPKDLVGIPWRVAFALQADGWYLRSEVIWHKPNPMPESVTDRPTKAHEQVFLLTKSERYFYDAESIKEPVALSQVGRIRADRVGGSSHVERGQHSEGGIYRSGNKVRKLGEDRDRPGSHLGASIPWESDGTGRNARSVWTITTKPYAGAHFATMPEKLAERCILAGSRPGDLVFDPFGGSGTTVRVARKFNRRGVMLDLNPKYLQLAAERISGVQTDIFEVPA